MSGMHPTTKLRPFEFQVRKRMREVAGQKILVACSGGADSVALVHLFAALAPRLKFEWGIAHIHHGPSLDHDVNRWRGDAQLFVQNLGAQVGARVYSNESSQAKLRSQSENELRNFRKNLLNQWRDEHGFTLLAFGHHADDLLETRLMRLARGTGPQGLGAMWENRAGVLRPLLTFSRQMIRQYLGALSVSWLEDPSNQDLRYFRNWLRQTWLPQLEAFRPKSVDQMADSLSLIAAELETPDHQRFRFSKSGICELDLVFFRSLSLKDRQRLLASLLAAFLEGGHLQEFKHSHIMEILKRLDTFQKVHRFPLLGLTWEVIGGRLQVASVKI